MRGLLDRILKRIDESDIPEKLVDWALTYLLGKLIKTTPMMSCPDECTEEEVASVQATCDTILEEECC